MVIRKKIFLILFFVSFCIYLLFSFFSPKLIYPTFERIQETTSKRNLERVHTSFENRIKILATVARDWGAWNDSCEYLKNKNKEFEDSNLTISTLSNFKADLMVYMDLDHNIVSQRFIGFYSDRKSFENPSENILMELKKYIDTISLSRPGELKSGFAYLDSRPMMIAVCAITDSELKQGPYGYLIIGTWIRDQVLKDIEKDFQLGVEFSSFTNSASLENKSYCECDSKHICYRKILKDITGTPHFILKIKEKSLLLSEGFKQVITLNVINFMFIITLTLLLWSLLSKHFFQPLQILTSYFSSPESSDLNNHSALDIQSSDEFEFLTSTFNKMSGKYKNNQLKLLFTLESINDGIWELNPETKEIELSSRSLNILDIDDDHENVMQWLDFSQLFAEEDQPLIMTLPENLMIKDDLRIIIEARLKQPYNKQVKWLLISARSFAPQKIIGTFLDISDKKDMEVRLEENRHLLNTLIEYIPIGIFAKNEESGEILSWNSKMEEISDMPRETVIGKTEEEALPFISRSSILQEDFKAVKKRQPSSECKRVVINNNQELWLNTTKLAIPSFNGKDELILSIVEDITEKKALESKLNQSEKLKAIGQLAGGVAHDFNNQLTAILGYASMIAEKVDDPDLLLCSETIISAAKYSADLTMKLLSFSRKGNQILVLVDMHQLIKEVVAILKHTFHKNISLEMKLNAESYYLKGDPGQLNNALINLALNARDSLQGKSGRVLISTENKFSENLNSESFILKIQDNGQGMTENVRQKIFEPFFTTKDVGQGSGLGLSAVFGTVEAHKGHITVESEPEKGSIFSLIFPLPKDISQSSEEESQKTDPHVISNKANVLIIEDEEVIRNLYKTTLHNMGHNTTIFAFSDEALDYYKECWEEVDLVILDIIMPGINGSELFSEMKKINPNIKVVIASGFVTESEVENLYNGGISSFIQKPFSHNKLQEIINKELEIN